MPARTSAQRRFHTKNTRIVRGRRTMDAPLQGDTGGHTGTAPTRLHHTFLHHSIKRHHPSTCNPPITNGQHRPRSYNTIHHLEMNEWADEISTIMFTSDGNTNFILPSREIKSCHGMVEIKWFYFRRSPIRSISITTSDLPD